MASITINIEHGKDQTWATDNVNSKQDLATLAQLIAAGGLPGDTCDIHTSASNLVAASATITCVFANTYNNDTVTIGNVTLTGKTASANETTQFKVETDNATMAESLKTTINANTTLTKYFVATRSSNVVTITCKFKGAIGNQIGLASSDADGLVVSGANFTGGTGGPETTAQSLER